MSIYRKDVRVSFGLDKCLVAVTEGDQKKKKKELPEGTNLELLQVCSYSADQREQGNQLPPNTSRG